MATGDTCTFMVDGVLQAQHVGRVHTNVCATTRGCRESQGFVTVSQVVEVVPVPLLCVRGYGYWWKLLGIGCRTSSFAPERSRTR
eukprot:COSAG01_NODE_15507_length_1329_cov_1.767480_2_plen_85_part_00